MHDDSAQRLRAAVVGTIGHRFTTENSVGVLRNGVEIFPAMLEAIDNAQTTIEFVTFVYWQGDIADEFASAFSKKASTGVDVRVILDGFGSEPMRADLIDSMRESGVEVEKFRPPVRWKAWKADHRTHRKILVCDDRVGFTGGVGIAPEWEGDARDPSEWRDTHFRIYGPAVMGLKAAFLTDWRDCERRMSDRDIAPRLPGPAGDVEVAVMNASAQIGYSEAERVAEAVLRSARHSIVVQTPYFNPTDVIADVLTEARRRGVEVDVMVPGEHIDKRISAVEARSTYRPLLRHGVRIWRYRPSMFHTKALIVDRVASVIGSINMNRRSVEKDEEVGLIVLDERLADQLTRHFEQDREVSDSVTFDEAEPGVAGKLAEILVKPIAGEL